MPSDLLDLFFWQMVLRAAGLSVARIFVSYLICLILALIIAIWLASSAKAEKIAVPIFDLVQNIPPLAFYPLAVLVFIKADLLEGSATFVLVTVMLWPLLFGLIGAVKQIPLDIKYAARIFGAKGLKYVRYIILPAVFPVAVTSSIVSWGIGWNLLVVAEWIRYGATDVRLQGLGGLLNEATASGAVDTALFTVAVLAILLIVFLLHIFVWRPLLEKSENYKFD
jgi:NitT/TauT family transport system permease protein